MSESYQTLRELVDAEGITRDVLVGEYSDMYKERYGIRPRWNYGLSMEGLIEEMEHLASLNREEYLEEKRGTEIRCVGTDIPNGMFSVGKVYTRGSNWLVEDDAGNARYVGSNLRFVLGGSVVLGGGLDTVHFAHFEVVEPE